MAPNSVAQRNAALRFFFVHVLKRPWTIEDTPYPKRPFRLPTVLSREEVKLGSVTERVQVEANAALVETRSTGIGQVVDSQQVIELPLNVSFSEIFANRSELFAIGMESIISPTNENGSGKASLSSKLNRQSVGRSVRLPSAYP